MKVSKQAKATLAFMVASLITQGLNLLATPIYVRLMAPEEIGIVSNFNTWMTMLAIVVNMMLHANSYIVAMNEYPDKRDRYTSVALSTSIGATIISLLFYLLFRKTLNNILGMNTFLVLVMYCGFFFHPATNMWMTRQRYEYKYVAVLVVSSIQALISTAFSVIAVINADRLGLTKPEARIVFTNLVTIVIGLCFTVILLKKGKCFVDKQYGKFILKVNTPTVVQALSKTVLDISDRLMIKAIVSEGALGIYGTIYSFASLPSILWNALNTAIVPEMFDCMNHIDTKLRDLHRLVIKVVLLYSGIVIGFTLVIPEILKVFTSEDYVREAALTVPIIGGCYIASLYSLIGDVLLYNKKTAALAWATGIAAIINVILNIVFLQLFGYYAAAYTTLFGFLVLAFCLYLSMRKIKNATKNFCRMQTLIFIYSITMVCIFGCPVIFDFVWIRYGIFCIGVFMVVIIAKKKNFIPIERRKE